MADGQAGQKRQAEVQTLTAEQINEVGKKWLHLVAQARADQTLKRRLMDTPVAVLQEHGINVRPGLDIRVVENTDKVAYLMLPAAGSELTDKDLDEVVGGSVAVVGTIVKAALGTLLNVVSAVGSAVGSLNIQGGKGPQRPL